MDETLQKVIAVCDGVVTAFDNGAGRALSDEERAAMRKLAVWFRDEFASWQRPPAGTLPKPATKTVH